MTPQFSHTVSVIDGAETLGVGMGDLLWRSISGQGGGEYELPSVGIRDIGIIQSGGSSTVVTTTGVGGGVMSFGLSQGSTATLNDSVMFGSGYTLAGTGTLNMLSTQGQNYLVSGVSATGQLLAHGLNADGSLTGQSILDAGVAAGSGSVAVSVSAGGMTYVAGSDASGGYIQGFNASGQGALVAGQMMRDTDQSHMSNPVDMTSVRVGDTDFVLGLCGDAAGVSAYAVTGSNGQLDLRSTLGASDGFGILSAPQAIEVISAHGATYVIVASASQMGQGGALSVMELDATGTLVPADHVLDSLNTRFGGVQSLSVVENDGWVYVLAAGGDDGLSLFTLMPDGQLRLLDTLVHETGYGMMDIEAMAAAVVGNELQVMIASQDSAGLSQVVFSLADQGQFVTASAGGGVLTATAADDIMTGGVGADTLRGGDGNDVIIDGDGQDQLTGGAGADVFVLDFDGESDHITDFDPAVDQLDLSSWPNLYDPNLVNVETTPLGAHVSFQGELLVVISASGEPLTRADIVGSMVQDAPTRPSIILIDDTLPEPEPIPEPDQALTGTPEIDVLEGGTGNDRILGLNGNDTLLGGNGHDFLGGGNGHDSLLGGSGNDTIYGASGNDTILGEGGNDLVYSLADNDVIDGGAGSDTIWGGGGNDTVYFSSGRDFNFMGSGNDNFINNTTETVDNFVWLGIGNDRATTGAGNDVIYGMAGIDVIISGAGNDTVYSGAENDTVDGGAGDDELWIGEGNDLLTAGAGNDLIYAREGHDNVSADEGNDTVHGGSGNDTIMGGRGNDTLFGGDGNDRIFGGNDNDFIFGGRGNDVIDMGAGNDRFIDTFQAGAAGADIITGGAGADVFQFTGQSSTDRITDFEVGIDTLRLTQNIWAGTRTNEEVVDDFANITGSGVVLNFGGGRTITLSGVFDTTNLADDLILF